MSSITLHRIAKEIAIAKRDNGDINLPEYILHGRDCIAELNLRGFIPTQSVELDIDRGSHSAKLPSDYLKYTKVGICVCNRIIELDYDETLCVHEPVETFCIPETTTEFTGMRNYYIIPKQFEPLTFKYTAEMSNVNGAEKVIGYPNREFICSFTPPEEQTNGVFTIEDVGVCGGTTTTTTTTTATTTDEQKIESDCNCLCNGVVPDGYTQYYNWNDISYNGIYREPLPTYPAYKSHGFFKIHNGRIYLNSVCGKYADSIVMQYKSTGVSETGRTEFPVILKSVIKAYVLWKSEMNNPRATLGQIEIKRREYFREKNLVRDNEILAGMLDMLKVQMSHISIANLGR